MLPKCICSRRVCCAGRVCIVCSFGRVCRVCCVGIICYAGRALNAVLEECTQSRRRVHAVFEESAVFAYCALAKYAKLADCYVLLEYAGDLKVCFACIGTMIT